ncbi:AlkZ family DNA glycosylase [Pedobacter sp. PAMC26386]|nr:AlkZ family DNA glycosylase [Pedobacter sp. PAMC26386]
MEKMLNIAMQRLVSQHFERTDFSTPVELVQWMGCMQAQDHAAVKWAIGNRVNGLTDAQVEEDFNAGKVLRTHVLRPTWHFVSPADIGWMLKLTAPRVKAMNKPQWRKLGIDEAIIKKSQELLIKALNGGYHLNRTELAEVFKNNKIDTDEMRMSYLLIEAELDGVICSGKREGKQFTYALFDERVPPVTSFDRETALAELTKRYFLSRGPATITDFCWWSGLNQTDVKRGIEMNKSHFVGEKIGEQVYWFSPNRKPAVKSKSVYLLSSFDELAIAYKDRTALIHHHLINQTKNGIFSPLIITEGQISGTWRRAFVKNEIQLEIMSLDPLDQYAVQMLHQEISRYGSFLEMKLQEPVIGI